MTFVDNAIDLWRNFLSLGHKTNKSKSLRRSFSSYSMIDRYLPAAAPGCGKPAAGRCCYRSTAQTDRQTDGQTDTVPLHRRLPPEAASVNKTTMNST